MGFVLGAVSCKQAVHCVLCFMASAPEFGARTSMVLCSLATFGLRLMVATAQKRPVFILESKNLERVILLTQSRDLTSVSFPISFVVSTSSAPINTPAKNLSIILTVSDVIFLENLLYFHLFYTTKDMR